MSCNNIQTLIYTYNGTERNIQSYFQKNVSKADVIFKRVHFNSLLEYVRYQIGIKLCFFNKDREPYIFYILMEECFWCSKINLIILNRTLSRKKSFLFKSTSVFSSFMSLHWQMISFLYRICECVSSLINLS